jgi:hypothetical protein
MRVTNELAKRWRNSSDVRLEAVCDDLINARADVERLRAECVDLVQERDGVKHSRACARNVAAGSPEESLCLRCERDDARANLAKYEAVVKAARTLNVARRHFAFNSEPMWNAANELDEKLARLDEVLHD